MVDISVSWMKSDLHPLPLLPHRSHSCFLRQFSITSFYRRKISLPSFHSFVYILNHKSLRACCFVLFSFDPLYSWRRDGALELPPFALYVLFHPWVHFLSPLHQGDTPHVCCFHNSKSTSVLKFKKKKKKCHQQVQPAAAVLTCYLPTRCTVASFTSHHILYLPADVASAFTCSTKCPKNTLESPVGVGKERLAS